MIIIDIETKAKSQQCDDAKLEGLLEEKDSQLPKMDKKQLAF